jgi:hypothetical protein
VWGTASLAIPGADAPAQQAALKIIIKIVKFRSRSQCGRYSAARKKIIADFLKSITKKKKKKKYSDNFFL